MMKLIKIDVKNFGGLSDSEWKISSQLQVFYGPNEACLLYTSPSPRDLSTSRMPSSA